MTNGNGEAITQFVNMFGSVECEFKKKVAGMENSIKKILIRIEFHDQFRMFIPPKNSKMLALLVFFCISQFNMFFFLSCFVLSPNVSIIVFSPITKYKRWW